MKPTKGPPAAKLRPCYPGPVVSRGKATSTAATHRAAKLDAPSLLSPAPASKTKEEAGRIATTPFKASVGDTTLPVGEIITENPHTAGDMGDMSSVSEKVSRASNTSVRRMKREAEKRDKHIDGLDALLKKILEKMTALDGTPKDVQK